MYNMTGMMMFGLFGPSDASSRKKPWARRRRSKTEKPGSGGPTTEDATNNLDEFEAKKPPVLKQVQQVRKWLEMSPFGETCSMELSKIKVTQQLGIPLRDLRILDPLLATSYPSALLAREKSIIVNIEFIKMIISLDKCYVTNLDDPNTADFIDHLQHRLKYGPTHSGVTEDHTSMASATVPVRPGETSKKKKGSQLALSGSKDILPQKVTASLPPMSPLPELPFELRVLETALDYISKYLEQQVSDVEAAGHPALDALTQKISTANLERVRRIKNRMVRLNTRIETLKEVLEKTLDDDADMKDFNLSALEEERLEYINRQAMRASLSAPFDMPMTLSSSASGLDRKSLTPQGQYLNKSLASSASSDTSLDSDEDVEVVEQILESYFMRLDNTWNKLQTLTEYVDDTEDFINIELDSHRNQLIRLDIVLTCFTACMGLITAVTALFAMNVDLVPEGGGGPYYWFVTISVATGVGAIMLFSSVMIYCKIKGLL